MTALMSGHDFFKQDFLDQALVSLSQFV
jgi:hypothetical protein